MMQLGRLENSSMSVTTQCCVLPMINVHNLCPQESHLDSMGEREACMKEESGS